jgi:pyruvate formate lyase activating enzyme
VFRIAKEKGLYTVYVTNGYESPDCLDFLAPYLDAVNIDLKSFSERFYSHIYEASPEHAFSTIRYCYQMGIHVELTTLVIPGEDDSEKELKDIVNFISSVSPEIIWHISAYHDDYNFQGKGKTPMTTLQQAAEIGKKAGLKYCYLRNVSSDISKRCSTCGKLII